MFWQFFAISVGLTTLFVIFTGPGLWSSGKKTDDDKKPDGKP